MADSGGSIPRGRISVSCMGSGVDPLPQRHSCPSVAAPQLQGRLWEGSPRMGEALPAAKALRYDAGSSWEAALRQRALTPPTAILPGGGGRWLTAASDMGLVVAVAPRYVANLAPSPTNWAPARP